MYVLSLLDCHLFLIMTKEEDNLSYYCCAVRTANASAFCSRRPVYRASWINFRYAKVLESDSASETASAVKVTFILCLRVTVLILDKTITDLIILTHKFWLYLQF